MTDAEYEELKYAAIGAGYKPVRLTDDSKAFLLEGVQKPWNPLTDDGDALRLAATVRIDIRYFTADVMAADKGHYILSEFFNDHPDVAAATRLAITRAAAEIGKQMGGGNV